MENQAATSPNPLTQTRTPLDLLAAVDIGSARIACAIAEVGGNGQPVIIAAESAASYGIRGGEIVDMRRASESIRIAIEAAAEQAGVEVHTVIAGFSSEVKFSVARASTELSGERRTVTAADVARLSKCVQAENGPGRRIVHRFDGPFSVGDVHGVENPEGLSGNRLEMHSTFLTASGDRLDNMLRAVRGAGVEIETLALEPLACSLGALSPDERALGAAVLDFGWGAFRGALWEGGRLRQIHIVGREASALAASAPQTAQNGGTGAPVPVIPPPPAGGMEGVILSLSRHFRVAPATMERVVRSHGALSDETLSGLPAAVEVAAADGLHSVKIETRDLSRVLEELLAPQLRTLREGLTGLSGAHSGGIVLSGGGARIKGMSTWVSKRLNGVQVRAGAPRWKVDANASSGDNFKGPSVCSLAGLVALGAERRKLSRKGKTGLFDTLAGRFKRLAASF